MDNLHDYSVELNEKHAAIAFDIKKKLGSFMRATGSTFEVRTRNNQDGNLEGLYIAGCNLKMDAITGLLDNTIAAKHGYEISELTRDPVVLRGEIDKAETKIVKLEGLVSKATRKQNEAEEELNQWIEGMEREEGYQGLIQLVVGEIARASGEDSYDQGMLQDPDRLKSYVAGFLEKISTGSFQTTKTETLKEDEVVLDLDPSKYLSNLEAIKLLFKLSNKRMAQSHVINYCNTRLEEELGWRTFADYAHLGVVRTNDGAHYDKEKVEQFLKGAKEVISSSSGKDQTVNRQNVIYIKSPEFAIFFRNGVYNEADAMKKYALSKKQLAGYSLVRSNSSAVPVLEKLEFETRTGSRIFYKREELDAIVN